MLFIGCATVVLVLAKAAGRAGTEGADEDIAGADGDEVVGADGREAVVVVGRGAADAAAVGAPARSQGFGGEGITDWRGRDSECLEVGVGVEDRAWSGRQCRSGIAL